MREYGYLYYGWGGDVFDEFGDGVDKGDLKWAKKSVFIDQKKI